MFVSFNNYLFDISLQNLNIYRDQSVKTLIND